MGKINLARVVLMCIVAVVVAGCAKQRYYHPTWGPERERQEFLDCQMKAEQTALEADNVFMVNRYMKMCLESKGFKPEG